MTPAHCPVCRGELVMGAVDVMEGGAAYYWWCSACDEARDTAAAAVPIGVTPGPDVDYAADGGG